MPRVKDRNNKIVGMSQEQALRLSPDDTFYTTGKKVMDIAIIFLSSVAVIPIMLVIAITIICDSPGHIFFSQIRLGKDRKPFKILKFRTMYETVSDPFHGAQATAHDLRVTRVGRWLRLSSLDELPQVWNVLRGDMSLIGPRPHALNHDRYFSQYIASYSQRYAVKPGISGWAQIHGYRGETPKVEDMQARVDKDLEYIVGRTWIMDIQILVKTLAVMIDPPHTLH